MLFFDNAIIIQYQLGAKAPSRMISFLYWPLTDDHRDCEMTMKEFNGPVFFTNHTG